MPRSRPRDLWQHAHWLQKLGLDNGYLHSCKDASREWQRFTAHLWRGRLEEEKAAQAQFL